MTKTNGRNTNGYVPARHILDELDKQKKEKKENPTYNTASLLNLKQGPISTKTADALVSAGKASATVKSGQIYVEPAKTAKTHETLFLPPAVETKRSETPASAAETSTKEQTKQKTGEKKNGFSAAKLAEGIINKGTTEAAHAMSSTLSLLEGAAFAPAEALTGFDDMQEQHGLFYKWNDAIERERKDAYRSSAANVAAGGTAAKIADTVGTAVVAAVPQAITALMSGGASVGTKGLEAAAAAAQRAPGLLNSLRSAASGLASNPNFWTSFLRTVGESYEQAKADGASDAKASAYAMGNGLLNAAAEVGGGLETLPKELQSGAPALKQWLRSAVQEGAEEPIQGVTERGLQNVVYGKKNPLFSVKDETAVFNPATAAKEFGVGAAVGGVLGGGQAVVGKVRQQSSVLGSAARRLISNENLARYRSVIDSVFSGDYPSESVIQMGETPEILLQYGASQHPLTLTQNTAYKIAYPQGYFGGKHNMGMSVLKQLPYQIADPVAILKSTSQPDSLIVLTKWKDGNTDVIVPIHLNKHGVIEPENRIASVYGKGHIDSIIGKNNENILYTKSGENIYQLLDKGVQFPQLLADDILARNSIAGTAQNVKSSPHDYAALLVELARERGGAKTLTPEQRRELEAWNSAFPELRMSEEEFLGR